MRDSTQRVELFRTMSGPLTLELPAKKIWNIFQTYGNNEEYLAEYYGDNDKVQLLSD